MNLGTFRINGKNGRSVVDSRADRAESKEESHSATTGQEQESSSQFVDHKSSEDSSTVVEELENSVDESPSLSAGDTDRFEDRVQVVRD